MSFAFDRFIDQICRLKPKNKLINVGLSILTIRPVFTRFFDGYTLDHSVRHKIITITMPLYFYKAGLPSRWVPIVNTNKRLLPTFDATSCRVFSVIFVFDSIAFAFWSITKQPLWVRPMFVSWYLKVKANWTFWRDKNL